CQHYYSAPHSF
nr:immunoglobulin light chain junction region [Macaca mulatta]MPN90871.1 immunoglobulin light chain junction region [Macaca mulatta]MPN92187.1 immunoglobulin light chain junction region [Macaca mulatta]MPN94329.1 immunoglobulin light chain junction region [Macaca mulatta]MPN94477.1 immunoglobulin light chain junction region [Macaca mulatta]